MTNAENPITDTVPSAEFQPRMNGQPMTLQILGEPVHQRYGYVDASTMMASRSGMSAEWRLVEEQELTNRLLELLIMVSQHGDLDLSMMARGPWKYPKR